jgi:DNA-binding transcriptional regulator/RsmH inhibitor MraZ
MAGDVSEILKLAEPPHSIASAKIDDKGRLKLPSESLEWCKKSNIFNVFVTTLDKRTFRIYSIPGWKSTLNLLEGPGEHAKAGADLALIAKVYGGDAEIDTQGRVLLPAALRALLGLESQPVWLNHVAGRIDGATHKVHEARMQNAETNLEDKVETFLKLGL